MYSISKKQYDLAKEIGVIIKPSQRKNKKIDIYGMDNEYHTSIGDIRFFDYFSYLETHGKDFADNRRRLYDIRTKKGLSIGSRNWFARAILWDLR